MGLIGFAILTHLLLKCHGDDYFYHQMDGDHKFNVSCRASGWQIDYQMHETGPCSRQCGELKEQLHSGGEDGTCQIEARTGFYACVHNCISKPIYPFNPHRDVVDTYIVAVGNRQSELPTQHVTEGSPILLDCSFAIVRQRHYVVYWLKVNSGDGRATCISSCSSEGHHHHQTCSEEPYFTSPPDLYWTSHNAKINRLNDSGVYVCVLNKLKRLRNYINDGNNAQDQNEPGLEYKHWIVIRNITVYLTRNGAPKTGADVGWYVAGAILLILLAVILLLAREKMKSNQARQSQMTQRSCHGDQGTTDPDCSPYAVGVRQHEPYSVVHIRKQTDSVASTPAGPSGQSSDVPEPYSVVQLRPEPDSTVPTPAGQTSDMPETYSVITPNRAE